MTTDLLTSGKVPIRDKSKCSEILLLDVGSAGDIFGCSLEEA